MSKNKFVFSSKSDVLKQLNKHEEFNIPQLFVFTIEEWKNNKTSVYQQIRSCFISGNLAVRSSCSHEDSEQSSGAGAYLSVLNVNIENEAEIVEAVERVIDSYGDAQNTDQVLVQRMIENVAVTGVTMTRVLADGSPYFVINYDDESGNTDSITGGTGTNKTVYIYRSAHANDFDSPRLRSFIDLARNVENVTGKDALDIEFCLDKNNKLHLLQARPICAQKNWPAKQQEIDSFINNVASFICRKTSAVSNLYGARSMLGVMPDWNPAEMIGLLPHPLAASLYRDLITSHVWSSARQRMGYMAVPYTELMLICAGRPYIDVRASFNSFLPAGLDPVIAEALVGAWLTRLNENPQFHDKVEFEIAQTSLDFCFDENLDKRYQGLLTSAMRQEFKEKLTALTASCLKTDSTLDDAMDRIIELRARQAGRPLPTRSNCPDLGSLPHILGECRKLGTLPFSILARHAFIAENLLRTAVVRGAITSERLASFRKSVKTISTELARDFRDVCIGKKDSSSFMAKYGHLRPGSYDILSPRYLDRHNLFASADYLARQNMEEHVFELTEKEKCSLQKLLCEHGLPESADNLLAYARKSISGRELGKFIFSRNLSDALETIAAWGADIGISRDDISWLPLHTILEHVYSVGPGQPGEYLQAVIKQNKMEFAKNSSLKLGYLIRSERDVYIVPQHRAAPNFIGSGMIVGEPALLGAESSCDVDIAGKIVCIENADPGFDWVFTRNIGGLITRFGGANSHMAIRCAEYGLPAAIGVGEKLFTDMTASACIRLDPANAILQTGTLA